MNKNGKRFKGFYKKPTHAALTIFTIVYIITLIFFGLTIILLNSLAFVNDGSAISLLSNDFVKPTNLGFYLGILLLFIFISILVFGIFFLYTTFLRPEVFNEITFLNYFQCITVSISITLILAIASITTKDLFALIVGVLSAVALTIQLLSFSTRVSREKSKE